MSSTARTLEPKRWLLDYFDAELHHRCTAVGLSHPRLAKQEFVTADLIGKVEAGMRLPGLYRAQHTDAILNADAALVRLRGLAVAGGECRQQAQQPRLGAAEAAQLRCLPAAIDPVPALHAGSSGFGLVDRIDDVIAVTTVATSWRG
ncbi:hypothetical protein F4553_000042 [Allocatelliglobosispora scoriae]|uniref:Uncharacterized protein n=1 Tax=Allocatelliglobosispora scoriae TaxID=643052 RepID=A0A841BHY0_9ACTN|nr:hypothetical protein [Allocatelliglobosispora scoriae]MBB5866663.1 hypothetical protein [Allocatelliglobosispora scoriae]